MKRLMQIVLAALLVSSGFAAAQTYPAKPVKIIVPFGPGSGTDTAARIVAQYLGTALGQSIVVENRPGASGSIAASGVARAAPDGYTLLAGTTSTHGANSGLIEKLPYDPLRDFIPVGLVALFNSFLVVHPSVPARNLAELIAYAKANPKALTYATGSTSSLLMGEMFKRGLGIEMLQVPFSSNPPGITEVVAGRVSLMFPDIQSSIAHVRSGALRALAVVSLGERSPLAPELPTIAESVLPGLNFVGWVGVFAPAGTLEPIVARLASELQKILAMPEVDQRFRQVGADVKPMTRTEFHDFVGSEVERWPRVLKKIGVRAQ